MQSALNPKSRFLGPLPDGLLLACVFAVLLAYAALEPSFEAPDEPEHLRHVQARFEGVDTRALAADGARHWGYEIIQPPLYYAIVALWARVIEPEFPDKIAINTAQNPRFPFIRHDVPGARYPWQGEHLGLRWLRLPSVLFGLLNALLMLRLGTRLFPDDRHARFLLVTLAVLVPNVLQSFSTVNNDGLLALLCTGSLLTAVALIQADRFSPLLFALVGTLLGLTVLTKLSAVLAFAAIGNLLLLDAGLQRRWRYYARGAVFALPPLLILGGGYLLANQLQFGDPTQDELHRALVPAFVRDTPSSISRVLGVMLERLPVGFAVDLCWQSVKDPRTGQLLFWSCMAGFFVCVVRSVGVSGKGRLVWLIAPIGMFWSMVFLVSIDRYWSNLQMRHIVCVWPLVVLAVVQGLVAFPAFWQRARPWACHLVLVYMLYTSLMVLKAFQVFYVPARESVEDLDYTVFIHTYVQNREAGLSYLRTGQPPQDSE